MTTNNYSMDDFLYNIEKCILDGLSHNFDNLNDINNYTRTQVSNLSVPNKREQKIYANYANNANNQQLLLKKKNNHSKQPQQTFHKVGTKQIEDLIKKVLTYNALYKVNLVKLCVNYVECQHCGFQPSGGGCNIRDWEFSSALHNYEILKGYKTIENDISHTENPSNNPYFKGYTFIHHNICSEIGKKIMEVYKCIDPHRQMNSSNIQKSDKVNVHDLASHYNTIELLQSIRPHQGRHCKCGYGQVSVIELDEFEKNKKAAHKHQQDNDQKNNDEQLKQPQQEENFWDALRSDMASLFPDRDVYCEIGAIITTSPLTLEELSIQNLKRSCTQKEFNKLPLNRDIIDKCKVMTNDSSLL